MNDPRSSDSYKRVADSGDIADTPLKLHLGRASTAARVQYETGACRRDIDC